MKANGNSGSRQFSARLKCTRPTRFQAGLSVLRTDCRSVPATMADIAACISAHSAWRTSGDTYSAPAIIGRASTSEASSALSGGAISAIPVEAGCRHSPAMYRAANWRHHTKTGGNACPTSPAPSWIKPGPLPWRKAAASRAATASSRSGPSSACSSTRCACGVSRRLRRGMGPGSAPSSAECRPPGQAALRSSAASLVSR